MDDSVQPPPLPLVPPLRTGSLEPDEHSPQALAKALHALAERVEQGVTANAALVDRMHGELERQKGDLLGRALSPLLFEIVGLHDQMLDVMDTLKQSNADLPSERVLGLFDVLRSRCEAILSGAGVFPFREDSRTFNPRRQRVVRRVLRVGGTGEVERSLGPGFERGDEVLCKERVEICARWP
jgi:molecular chaperone GrpE (heat shock protein)